MQTLAGKVAVVTGASRNGGRGIALNQPTATIDDTAKFIRACGGKAIPVRVDHTIDDQVAALFALVQREHGHLDILVSNLWGGYELLDGFWQHTPFWELPLLQWDLMHTAGLRSHMITSRLAIPLMLLLQGGLIVITTTGIDPLGPSHDHLFYDTFKVAINRLAFGLAQDCARYGVAVVALSLGNASLFMRTWGPDPAQEDDPNAPFLTFSPEYAGRAVVALASDPNVMDKVGQAPFLEVPALAREYGFTDIDGRQP